MQAVTCLRCNLLNFRTQAFLAFAHREAEHWFVALRPRRFHYNAPQVGVAGFGNPSAASLAPAGVLAGYRPTVSQ